MKKLILSVSAVAGLSLAGHAQGYIAFSSASNGGNGASSSATTGGLVFINGALDTTTDINLELLYSSTQAGTYSPVVTLLLSSSASASTPALGQISGAATDITGLHNGAILDPSGNTYGGGTALGVGVGGTAYFEVAGWTGSSSTMPTASSTVAVGMTGPFVVTLSSANPPIANIGGMPSLDLQTSVVPEPSTLAMAGVGMASMLMLRRRKS